MLSLFRRSKKSQKEKDFTKVLEQTNPSDSTDLPIYPSLEDNLQLIKKVFENSSDVNFRKIQVNETLKGLVVYIDGMADTKAIGDNVLKELLASYRKNPDQIQNKSELQNNVSFPSVQFTKEFKKVFSQILFGAAVLFADGCEEAMILSVRKGVRRGVSEPTTEASIRGPREGFTENLRTNTALLRFRLKTTKLKFEPFVKGEQTQTNIVLCYIEGLADKSVLDEVRKRLDRIEIDSVLETGYIEELIEDNPYSPFPQLQYTERPDAAAGQLLEGCFAIFVDGTPFVLIGPVTAWQMLHASEDYYERFYISNFIRWLRFFFLFVALFTPALYIAVTTFHQDMLPTTLILSIAAAREAIPFPALVEALIMELSFEALREASVRLPKTVGQAVSILGALVIGQAAVEAGIVSAPMVIIVSMTGIASFAIPKFNFAISIRLIRFPLMILAGAFGLFGIIIGSSVVIAHVAQLHSFGVPYLSGLAPLKQHELKDILVRAPWWKMIHRPSSYARRNLKRMKRGNQTAIK
ncbi:spore germination protein [Peribacillus sp. SCS-155]|uniref:spore germination protein n=1 Tax=Peribacillus sedimenti TaxID=3115297 RepID=UPI00390666BA